MTQTCNRCGLSKNRDKFYMSKQNLSGLEYTCKSCKRIQGAVRRFNVSKNFVEWLYSHDTCMCCGDILDQNRQTHILHTDEGVQGVVCSSCNYILGQETDNNLIRIKLCLKFMSKNRENLIDRVNQQESLKLFSMEDKKKFENPQRLARYETRGSKICSRCGQPKFGRCNNCKRIEQKARYSGLSVRLITQLQTINKCECCNCVFTKENKQCIHHTNALRGVVCNSCNQILGNESEQRRMQLLACVLWIEESMIQSDLYRNIERLAEMSNPAYNGE